MNKEVKDIFNKWGTYQSFEKDVMIINYFTSHTDKREHRQKEIINFFEGDMAPITVQKHLYKLLKKGVIRESREFHGTYYMDDPPNLGKIVAAILGEPMYNALLNEWTQKLSEHEQATEQERRRMEREQWERDSALHYH